MKPLGSTSDKGIKKALKTIKSHSPERIVIEAIGRLEMPFVLACAEAQLPIVRENPVHIKRFAGAIGRRAKNDRLDAELIAHYGEAIKPALTVIKPKNIRLMSDLVIRRNQLLSMQCNPIFKATYARLLAAGKPKKVAIIACVREMVVTLNSMLRDGAMWDENIAKH